MFLIFQMRLFYPSSPGLESRNFSERNRTKKTPLKAMMGPENHLRLPFEGPGSFSDAKLLLLGGGFKYVWHFHPYLGKFHPI